jgi:hypothetical protein
MPLGHDLANRQSRHVLTMTGLLAVPGFGLVLEYYDLGAFPLLSYLSNDPCTLYRRMTERHACVARDHQNVQELYLVSGLSVKKLNVYSLAGFHTELLTTRPYDRKCHNIPSFRVILYAERRFNTSRVLYSMKQRP